MCQMLIDVLCDLDAVGLSVSFARVPPGVVLEVGGEVGRSYIACAVFRSDGDWYGLPDVQCDHIFVVQSHGSLSISDVIAWLRVVVDGHKFSSELGWFDSADC